MNPITNTARISTHMNTMLTVVGWLWRDKNCRTEYLPEHANIWARMIHRNLTLPHRFLLLTDRVKARYDPLIQPVALWEDLRDFRFSSWRPEFPQCWTRLKAFSEEARSVLGERFVSVDLDCVVTGILDALFDRSEDFLICRRAPLRRQDVKNRYQASMFMMTAGARRKVWNDFRGEKSLEAIRAKYVPEAAKKFLATDQGWMLYRLGKDEAGWSTEDGVYFWPWLRANDRINQLPENARIVFFQGETKPWTLNGEAPEWVKENYK